MSFSVRERQIDAIKRMLRLNLSQDSSEYWENLWKILIYDDYCQDVLAPLFPVEELRKQGITLHLSLHKPRQPVPEVPAIYFVNPTPENLARICEDCANRLYDSFHLNFSSSISRDLLEELVLSTIKSGTTKHISRVFDQFMNFISLEDNLFITRHLDSYYDFHSPRITDNEAISNVSKTVDGLFSVVAALGKVPIIQCPGKRGDAAEIVAKQLDEKIRNHRSNVSNLFSEGNSGYTTTSQRPVLIILDRNIDLAVMMAHAWSYQALVHDLLNMHLNRVTVQPRKGSDKVTVPVNYNLDPNEPFWRQNVGAPFPQVAVSVKQQVEEFEGKYKKRETSDQGENDDFEATQDLSRKIDEIPQIQMQKFIIEMHAKIAYALLDVINARELDVFFRLEEAIMTRSVTQKKKDILAALDGTGTNEDKLRLFLIYFITHPNLTSAELSEFEEKLTSLGCDLTPLNYLKSTKTFDDHWATTSSTPTTTSTNTKQTNSQGSFAGVGDWVGSFKSMFSAGIQMFVPTQKNYYVTRIVDAIMEIKQDKLTSDFLYFDPMYAPHTAPRRTVPFREAIVFIVGGGNYLEFQNLKEYAENSSITKEGLTVGKKIIYGSTELLTGEQFLRQLHKLASSET